jgi:phenylacetate 2-hydroxylase
VASYLHNSQIESNRTNFYKVAKIPEAPGGVLFIAHLHALGGRRKLNDATVFSQWGAQLNSGIPQIRFGNQRNIVIGSWAAMKELWIDRNTSLLDRPHHVGSLSCHTSFLFL